MGKVKALEETPKEALRRPKNGSIHKKKNKKLKDPSAVKAAVKNGVEAMTNASPIIQKNGNSRPKSKKSKKISGQNSGSPRSSEKSPRMKKQKKDDDEDDDDSGEDINEGISVNEVLSAQEDEVDDDDSSDDGAMPDIFGNSLAEETDDDDDEFDADEDKKKDINKGIKMFEGVEKLDKGAKSEEEDDDEEEEDSSDDDEDDDENVDDENDKSALGLSALLGESIKDESDDEDFEVDDDSDNDEEESDKPINKSLNSSNVTSTKGDDDDEENEDDDEDDEDESDDDSAPDLTALLGNTLVDESDDDDFEGNEDEDDEDEDISDEDDDELPESSKVKKSVKAKTNNDEEQEDEEEEEENDATNESHDSMEMITDKDTREVRQMSQEEKAELDRRTIFVGNIPKDTKIGRLKSEFKQFGPIENLRIRGIIPENPKIPLKVAAITKKYHPKSTTVCAFITFKKEESVEKALSMNGKKFEGNYLRVDQSGSREHPDKNKSVFLGNLPFTIEDNEIWETFKDCGKIDSVRIVRDRKTGLGRGFGYINFKTSDGATLAMDLNGTTIQNRELRINVITSQNTKNKREQKKGKKRGRSDHTGKNSPKKFRADDSTDVKTATHNSINAEKRKAKRSQGEKQRGKSQSTSPHGKFQGQTADGKKKEQKKDKSFKKKQQMAAKLLAKPKKPSTN